VFSNRDFGGKIHTDFKWELCAEHIFAKEESDIEANDASAGLANLRDLYVQ